MKRELIFGLGVGPALLAHAGEGVPQTRLGFIDACTQIPTATSSPNGVKVVLEISGLTPRQPVWLDFQMGPEYIEGKLTERWRKRHSRFHSPSKHSDRNGIIRFTQKVHFKFPKSKAPDQLQRRVWSAQVHWVEKTTLKSGSASASLLMLDSENERFYSTLGSSICYWQSPLQIQSDYHYNFSWRQSRHPRV